MKTLCGSYFGDWDNESGLLRSALASGDCLAVLWSGRPHAYIHWMAAGETIGYCNALTTNNKIPSGDVRPLYKSYIASVESYYPTNGINGTHISLLGDPTLRMDVVKPLPSDPTASEVSGAVTVSWSAPSPAPDNYSVFRAPSKAGPFTYLGDAATTSFVQSVGKGAYTYMVRARKLQASSSGSYYNLSEGKFANVTVNGGSNWTLTDLGVLNAGAGAYSYGMALNNISDRTVVGWSLYGTLDHAFRWRASDGMADMPVWGTSDHSYAYGVNDSRTIVGYGDYNSAGTLVRAFRWTPAGGMTVLGTLYGTAEGQAINNLGTTVGHAVNSYGYTRAVRWEAGLTTATNLGAIVADESAHSYAYAINSAGFVAGKSKTAAGTAGYYHAFLSKPSAFIQATDDLFTLGGNNSEALGVNTACDVVGESENTSAQWRAFIWNTGSGFTELGTLNGATTSYANAVNNYGQVVGNSGGLAFIWQRGAGIRKLNDFRPNTVMNLRSAEGINDRGEITGYAFDYYGATHAFLLTPATPNQ